MSTPNPPQKQSSPGVQKGSDAIVLAKLQSCNQKNPSHTSISPLSYKQRCPNSASLQDTSQNFHFGLSCFASAIGGRQLATQRFHLPAKGCMRMPHPIGIQTMCVPHIVCARSMEMYGSFTVLGRTWNLKQIRWFHPISHGRYCGSFQKLGIFHSTCLLH